MPFFSKRVSMLEVQNRALIKTAGERAERIDKLEHELRQELQLLNRELERLKADREFYFKRVEELEEHNRALTDSATKYSMLSQKLERELAEASIKYQKLERELTEAATKYSLWGQKLERELARIDPNGAPRRRFGAQCED